MERPATDPATSNGHALTLTIPTRAGDIVFRIPNEMDLWLVYGSLPLLKMAALEGGPAPSAQTLTENFRKGKEAVAILNEMIIACALAPELTDKKCVPTKELVYVECLSVKERSDIVRRLQDAAGASAKEAARIRPTLPTVEPDKISASSTPSESATGEGPAS